MHHYYYYKERPLPKLLSHGYFIREASMFLKLIEKILGSTEDVFSTASEH